MSEQEESDKLGVKIKLGKNLIYLSESKHAQNVPLILLYMKTEIDSGKKKNLTNFPRSYNNDRIGYL